MAVGGEDVAAPDSVITIEQFTHRFNTWKLIARIPEECHKYAVLNVGETVWILGGCDRSGAAESKVFNAFIEKRTAGLADSRL